MTWITEPRSLTLDPALVRGFLCCGFCAVVREPGTPASETSPWRAGVGGL